MALLLVLTSTSTTNVLAKADDTDGSKKVIESSISKISDLENQIKELNDKKQEKAKLEEEIRDKNNKIAQLNKEIEDLKNSNNDELIAEITPLKDELKRLQDEHAKIK